MKEGRGTTLVNGLTLLVLALTILAIVFYASILVYPRVFFNPFPSRMAAVVTPASPTPTSTSTIPATLTPTDTPSPTPSPSVAPTRTPSPIPIATAMWPPISTSVPRVTRSPFPFSCVVEYRRPPYDHWSGVAGHVQDLNGQPLPGYFFRSERAGTSPLSQPAGGDTRVNMVYGNEAAWEQVYDAEYYRTMEIRVQLYNRTPEEDGTYRAVSNEVLVELGGYATKSLGYVTCTLNWENWP